jgi:nonsense-mediated mRNA decay protein 3
MDFYFLGKQQAVKFIDFLESYIPMTLKYSRKLVSADHTNNIGNYKHNYIVLIPPICKDDLVILPKALAKSLSDISPLVLIKTIGASIHVLDPFTCEVFNHIIYT